MPKFTLALDDWLDRSPRVSLGLGLLILLLVGLFHHGSSKEYNFDFFYIIPVAFAARYCGRLAGFSVSILAAATWFASDYWNFYTDQLWLTDWNLTPLQLSLINAALCLSIFLAVALLVSMLESDIVLEKARAQTKSDMLSIVSHEVSNALTTMGMAIFVLEEEMGDEPKPHQAEMYDVLHRNITSLKRDVENLLNEARMESGHFALEIRRVDAAELARSALAVIESSARQKKMEMSVKLPPRPLFVRADPDALHLVLTNLIGNAIKYTRPGGRVAVELKPSGEPPIAVLFSISDNGIGMSPEEQEEALKGFTRSSRGKKMAAGFGLGLKTARDMLASHGARLDIESSQNSGSRFSFSLPAAQDQSPTRA